MNGTYTTISGDQWDQIALKVYGDEHCAGALMQANPEQLDVFQFDAGVILRTPEISTESSDFLPTWRTGS